MTAVSLCPRCQKPVSLPAGVNSAAIVRCPLCDAEYELREAIPPKLMPIAVVTPQQPTATANAEYAEHHAIRVHTGEGQPDENEAVMAARTLVAASRVPKPVAPRSAVKTFVQVVLGGLAGCLVAYYALAAYYGPDLLTRGLPELPLPYIARLLHPGQQQRDVDELREREEPSPEPDTKIEPEPAAPATTKLPPIELPRDLVPAEAAKKKLLKPLPGSREYIGPRAGPTITSDQLADALRKANAVSITTADDPMPPKLYEAFCRLGEAITFVNGRADTELLERIAAVKTMLDKLGRPVQRLDRIGELADGLLDGKRPQNGGILLAGTVKDITRRGLLWIGTVQLSGRSTQISVVTSEPMMDVKTDDRIVTLGVAVDQPESNLVGYTGATPTVVWSGATVKLP